MASPPQPSILRCPSCASPLKAEDLDAARTYARCSHCGTLMSLAQVDLPPSEWQPRPDVGLPDGLVVERQGGTLEIRRRWFTPALFFLLFFCVAWNAFLVFWYSIAFSTRAPWIMKVFPLAHVAVGVGLTYSVVAGFLNRTCIRAGEGLLTVRHGPVPWFGNHTLPVPGIDQLYCRRRTRSNRNGHSILYEVWIRTHDGKTRKLVGNDLTEDQALAIEQQIERALRIRDRHMPGELER